MTVVGWVVALVLGAGAAAALARVVRGPSLLDRLVAMDMLVALVVCGLATAAAVTRDSATVIVLVVLTLLGFTGTVSVARLLLAERDGHDETRHETGR